MLSGGTEITEAPSPWPGGAAYGPRLCLGRQCRPHSRRNLPSATSQSLSSSSSSSAQQPRLLLRLQGPLPRWGWRELATSTGPPGDKGEMLDWKLCWCVNLPGRFGAHAAAPDTRTLVQKATGPPVSPPTPHSCPGACAHVPPLPPPPLPVYMADTPFCLRPQLQPPLQLFFL